MSAFIQELQRFQRYQVFDRVQCTEGLHQKSVFSLAG